MAGLRRDEYGNPIPTSRVDDFGEPIPPSRQHDVSGGYGATGGGYGSATAGDVFGGTGGQYQPKRTEQQGISGMLHRSGSGSSSSSEDDGMGGRRKKKGLTEKIKEKLPGGHKSSDEQRYHEQTQPEHYEQQGEKKGMMEKIKEKLPGHHQRE